MLATYNEAENIEAVLEEVADAAERLRARGIDLGVLLVDDQSPDGTAAIATGAARRLGLPIAVESGPKAGLGSAYVRGLRAATGSGPGPLGDGRPATFIVTLDADRQHDARQIPILLEAFLATGAGVLIGSRWVPGGASPGTSIARMVLSRVGNCTFRIVTGTHGVRDATTAFRVIDPEVARAFDHADLRVSGYAFFSSFVAVAQAGGAIVAETPITFRPRGGGQSKLTLADGIEFARNLVLIRRRVRAIRAGRAGLSPASAASGAARHDAIGAALELHRLRDARRFSHWIVDELGAGSGEAEGGVIAHVGAGIGTITAELRRRHPGSRIIAVEQAPVLRRALEAAAARHHFDVAGSLGGALAMLGPARSRPGFDTVVLTGVLEHRTDDVALLRAAHDAVRPGGKVVGLVPATPEAFGTWDHLAGHQRRYTRDALRHALEGAGLEIESISALDRLGLVIYRIAFRTLRLPTLSSTKVRLYDAIVPISRAVDRHVAPGRPGRNLVFRAARPPER
jgi:precorrin-6B methylase 2